MQTFTSPSQVGQYLNQRFLQGQGRITQLPGQAAPSTRRFYSHHQGYDLATKAGTPIQTQGLQYQGAWQDRTGYGQRASYYDPQNQRSYIFSHLSHVSPTGQAYTGGIPGLHGNTTGPHLDVVIRGGLYKPQSSYAQQLGKIRNPVAYQGRKINIGNILGQIKSKFGQHLKVLAVSRNPQRLHSMQQKYGGKIIKV